jgi:hypothetical protein
VARDRIEIRAERVEIEGMCTAAWLPSTSTGTPLAWAASITGFTSKTVPSTFDMWLIATSLVAARWRRSRLRVEIAIGVHLDPFQHHALPFAQEMPRHDIGVVFGMIVRTISSPASIRGMAQP